MSCGLAQAFLLCAHDIPLLALKRPGARRGHGSWAEAANGHCVPVVYLQQYPAPCTLCPNEISYFSLSSRFFTGIDLSMVQSTLERFKKYMRRLCPWEAHLLCVSLVYCVGLSICILCIGLVSLLCVEWNYVFHLILCVCVCVCVCLSVHVHMKNGNCFTV